MPQTTTVEDGVSGGGGHQPLQSAGPDHGEGRTSERLLESHVVKGRLVWGLVGLWAAGLLVLHAFLFGRFLDFFDESYMLILTRNPGASRNAGEIFLLQFLVHPLYELVGGDLARYRLLGLLVLLAAVAVMVLAVTNLMPESWRDRGGPGRWVFFLVSAASATTLYAYSGRTLNYRSVAVIGLCLIVAAVALAFDGRPSAGGALFSVAAAVTFAGKPTTGAAAAAVALVVVVLGRVPLVRFLAGAALSGLATLGVLCVLTSMSPVGIVDYMHRGYTQLSRGTSYSSIFDLLGVAPSPLLAVLLFGPIILGPALVVGVGALRSKPEKWPPLVVLAGGVGGAALVTFVCVSGLSERSFGDQVLPLTVLLFALTVALAIRALSGDPERAWGARRPWLVVGLMTVLPWVAALGTNTRYVYNMAQAAVFWSLALLLTVVLLSDHLATAARLFLPVCLAILSVATTIGVLYLTNGNPRDSVVAATVPVEVGGGTLGLDPDDAVVMTELARIRDQYRLEGVPSIDLTGYGSGYLYQLGTRPLGRASFFGFFKGADRSAAYALSFEGCRDKARAWLLQAEDNPADVSQGFVTGSLDLERDYEVVTTFHPTQGPQEWHGVTFRLLRPGPTVASALGCGPRD